MNRFAARLALAAGLACGLAAPAAAQVVRAQSVAYSDPASGTITGYSIPAGSNRLLVVIVADDDTDVVTSATFAGTPMNVGTSEAQAGAAADKLFWLLIPGTGATSGNIVTVVGPGSSPNPAAIMTHVFTGVDSTTPVSSPLHTLVSTGGPHNASSNLTVTSAANDLVLDHCDIYDQTAVGTQTPGGGQTVFGTASHVVPASGLYAYYKDSIRPGASPNVSMSWSTSGTDLIHLAINIKAAVVTPTIAVVGGPLTLGTVNSGTPGTASTFSVSGTGLTADITLTAPSRVEISKTGAGGPYASTQTLTQSGGTVGSTTIHARIAASAIAGTVSGNITAASTGATTQNVAVSGQVNGTPATAGQLLIEELRFRGPGGTNDEYVVVYNTLATTHTVGTNDGSSGYGIFASDGVVRGIIPNGTVIAARGHVLLTNASGYSLAGHPNGVANFTWSTDIANDTGIALCNSATTVTGHVIDAAGTTGVSTPYREGTGFGLVAATAAEHAWVRRRTQPGQPIDTGNNATDFVLVSTTTAAINGITPVLGSPGPENQAGPVTIPAGLASNDLDALAASTAAPNYVRDGTPGATPVRLGTIRFRRKLTNNTGAPVNTLRFRVVDITTSGSAPVYAPQADLRVVTSADDPAVTVTGGGTVAVKGTTVVSTPAVAAGGGLNTLVTVSLGAAIPNGGTINVSFLFGVENKGNYNAFVIWETLP